jgi:molecular chaperone GrpE
MPGADRDSNDCFVISKQQQLEIIAQIGCLLKERRSLQQSLAKQIEVNNTNSEQLFLELLEIFDTLESLIEYFQTNHRLTERAIERLPKSLSTIQSKLLATLGRRQVKIIELTDTDLDPDLCQIVDTQINPDVTSPVVTKVVRQGFKIGDRLLRPVEVTIDSPGMVDGG